MADSDSNEDLIRIIRSLLVLQRRPEQIEAALRAFHGAYAVRVLGLIRSTLKSARFDEITRSDVNSIETEVWRAVYNKLTTDPVSFLTVGGEGPTSIINIAYLFRMVKNKCIDHLRKVGRLPVSVDPFTLSRLAGSPGISEFPIAFEQAFQKCFDELTFSERELVALLWAHYNLEETALMLLETHGMEYSSVTEGLNKDGGNCYQIVSRTRAKLRKCLKCELFPQEEPNV